MSVFGNYIEGYEALLRRIYSKKETGKPRDRALAQFRETRDMLNQSHPGLLAALKGRILGDDSEEEIPDMVPIDRKKNMETVLKFMEISPDSDLLKGELKTFLSDKYH